MFASVCFEVRSGLRCAVLIALAVGVLGCRSESLQPNETGKDGSSGAATDRVALGPGTLQSGFSSGPLRFERRLARFEIGRYPVTWNQYEACAAAGACAAPDASACAASAYEPYPRYQTPKYDRKVAAAPATCVGEKQAEAYCSWVGGRLPRLDEWLLAARGDVPRRFSWGDLPSRCDQHAMAPALLERIPNESAVYPPDAEQAAALLGAPARGASKGRSADGPLLGEMAARRPAAPEREPESCPAVAFDGSELHVGKHRSGASPSGVEDVLSVPAELLAGDPDTIFNACGDREKHCVVFGLDPAAIDSVAAFVTVPADDGRTRQTIAHAYAFRCAFDVQEAR